MSCLFYSLAVLSFFFSFMYFSFAQPPPSISCALSFPPYVHMYASAVICLCFVLCICTVHIPHQDLWNIQRFLPPTLSFVRGFFVQLHRASVRFILCVRVYTAYENNESEIILAFCEGVLKNNVKLRRTVHEGFRGGIEV